MIEPIRVEQGECEMTMRFRDDSQLIVTISVNAGLITRVRVDPELKIPSIIFKEVSQ